VALAIGARVRARREAVRSLRERAARAEVEAGQRAERLRGLERERIAREMHDVLAHRISMVSLYAGALEIRPDLSAEEVAKTAGTIRVNAHHALEELREILGLLRNGGDGGTLRPQPGLAELDQLIAEARAAGTPVEVDNRLPGLPGAEVPPVVSRTAYRIVQEGLTNARKHAPGAPVHLQLDGTPGGELHVWLRNKLMTAPGRAIPGAGSGLLGLGERVSLSGGRIDHGARRGPDGEITFQLEAWVPWPGDPGAASGQ
jgi:signal transduction histidine kinase